MTIQRTTLLLLTLCLSVSLIACSSIPTHKPIAPEVTVESVKPVSIGLTEQTLAFELNLFNPNEYNLPVDSLDFIASYQGEPLAQGTRSEAFELPSKSNTELDLVVKTRIGKMLGELLKAAANDEHLLNITIEGSVKLNNWPARIPFSVDRSIDNPMLTD